jgi:hypothetical protein
MKHARDIIRAIFDESHARQAENYSELFDGWRAIAGDDIASHSRIVDITDGTVLVEADHPGWLQMISLKERGFVITLQKKYPSLGIARLRVRTAANPASISGPDRLGPIDKTKLPPIAPNRSEIEELRDVDSDEYHEFKDLLERVRNLGDQK